MLEPDLSRTFPEKLPVAWALAAGEMASAKAQTSKRKASLVKIAAVLLFVLVVLMVDAPFEIPVFRACYFPCRRATNIWRNFSDCTSTQTLALGATLSRPSMM
jgi:hypothetical protein